MSPAARRRLGGRGVVAVIVALGLAVLVAVLSIVGDGGPREIDRTGADRPRRAGAEPARRGGVDGGYASASVGTIAGSECPVFPADNVWHSVVDGPDVPVVPAEDPRSRWLAAMGGPVRASFSATVGEGLDVVPSEGSTEQVLSVAPNWLAPGNQADARSSDADAVTYATLGAPLFSALLEAPPPERFRWTDMSLDPAGDNRFYLVDTRTCTDTEAIGFSGLALRAGQGLVANRMSRFDLRSNNRRASRVWGEGPCPEVQPNPFFAPSCDGTVDKPSAARGGSGLSGLGGLLRAEEIGKGIDHAIAAILPANAIARDGHTWPATTSDGTGEPGVPAGAPPDGRPLPMGSRLRLRQDYEPLCTPDECPQATELVRALKRHGAIVVDSTAPVPSLGEALISLTGELSAEWDRDDLVQLYAPVGEPGRLRASDFELVDAEDMRALPAAGPQDDDWLKVR
jgi:hypothetical protein